LGQGLRVDKGRAGLVGRPDARHHHLGLPEHPIFGDAFDAAGDLWVSTVKSVVEFSKAGLATMDPAPTRTISSSGGAQLVFDPSGDLWMVTGGGPDCFGTPCTNEVVKFTKAQLSGPGSPPPAVTVSSTVPGSPTGSLYGPYSLAFISSGDLWVELQQQHHSRVRPGPAPQFGGAHPYADHRRPKYRDELPVICRHRAVRGPQETEPSQCRRTPMMVDISGDRTTSVASRSGC
jgi:hypothetical protein